MFCKKKKKLKLYSTTHGYTAFLNFTLTSTCFTPNIYPLHIPSLSQTSSSFTPDCMLSDDLKLLFASKETVPTQTLHFLIHPILLPDSSRTASCFMTNSYLLHPVRLPASSRTASCFILNGFLLQTNGYLLHPEHLPVSESTVQIPASTLTATCFILTTILFLP